MKRLFVVLLLLLLGVGTGEAQPSSIEPQGTIDRFDRSRDRIIISWWLCDPNSQSRSICFETGSGHLFEMSLRESRIIPVEADRIVARAHESNAAYSHAVWKGSQSRANLRIAGRAARRVNRVRANSSGSKVTSAAVAPRIPVGSAPTQSRPSYQQQEIERLQQQVTVLTQERDQARQHLAQSTKTLQGVDARLSEIREAQRVPAAVSFPWWFKTLAFIVLVASLTSLFFFGYAAILLVRIARQVNVIVPSIIGGATWFRRRTRTTSQSPNSSRSDERRFRRPERRVDRTEQESEVVQGPVPPEPEGPPIRL